MRYFILLILLFSLPSINTYAQEQTDTARTLNEVTIYDIRRDVNIGGLDSIRGT